MGGAAIIFKGSGFYETDYRSEAYKSAANADKEPSSGGDKQDANGKSDTSTESKPAETTKTTKSKTTKSDD